MHALPALVPTGFAAVPIALVSGLWAWLRGCQAQVASVGGACAAFGWLFGIVAVEGLCLLAAHGAARLRLRLAAARE